MQEEIAGLYVGHEFIMAAEVSVSDHAFQVKRLGWTKCEDEEDAPLCSQVRAAMAEARVRTCTVAGTVRSNGCLVKPFSYPYLKHDELLSALKLEAEEALMLPQHDICLDWHVNSRERPGGGAENGGHIDGIMTAASRVDVEANIKMLRRARLYPIRLQAEIIPTINFFLAAAPEELRKPGTCLIYQMPRKIHICVFYGDKAVFPRTITVREKGHERVVEIIEGVQEDLRYLVYKLHKPEIDQMVIVGEKEDERGELVDRLEDAFGVPVRCWNTLEGITIKPQLREKLNESEAPGSRILPVLGLAIHGK